MNVKLNPETAARLAVELFPGSDVSESLEKLVEWLTIFSLKHQEIRDSVIQRSQPITQGDTIRSIGTQETRTRHRNNSKAKEMIHELFAYAKASRFTIAHLAREMQTTSTSLSNWRNGGMPNRSSVLKIEVFLEQVKKEYSSSRFPPSSENL